MESIILLVILGTSIWVFFDTRAIGVKKGLVKGFLDMGPWGWFFATLFLWIVGFPAYLTTRGKYKRIHQQSGL
ncbi:MAG: hypothetical protein PHY78_08645 [Desulfobacterales bacterium]|nr:hypothetical protein [Desulfobacterales bacterium]MDD4393796.1 hypothetical protein [Desulfobacterales bacterium]